MDMRKYAGAAFIKVDDVRARPLELQIAVVKAGKFDKPDLVFETGETFSLNATNTRALIQAWGADSKDWIGKEIKLKLGVIPYQGKDQDAVIVEPISPPITAPEKTEAAAKLDSDEARLIDSEIPF
jgi:hypothetical protein